jgi:hypothetical protein
MDHKIVISAVQEIEAAAGDPETAHLLEDALYERLLRAIADDNCANVRLCAELALQSKDLKFPRRCA